MTHAGELRADRFSDTYGEARSRFREAAATRSAEQFELPLADSSGELAIDVAVLGTRDAETAVVVSSGLHGVEGYFGSAVQTSWLRGGDCGDRRVVLLHGLNPYGFREGRRVDAGNVDLNRNCLADPAAFRGCADAYRSLDPLLNPTRLERGREWFTLRALRAIRRYGFAALKEAVAGGQYEFERGLFYGGAALAPSIVALRAGLPRWLGGARRVVHLDLHTGLGRSGRGRLLLEDDVAPPFVEWAQRSFGAESVEVVRSGASTAYRAAGTLAGWLQRGAGGALDPAVDYRVLTAEFGTHRILRVLAALREENCVHHLGTPQSPQWARTKTELKECFAPASPRWRRRAVSGAIEFVRRACVA